MDPGLGFDASVSQSFNHSYDILMQRQSEVERQRTGGSQR